MCADEMLERAAAGRHEALAAEAIAICEPRIGMGEVG
jgi:phage baseplate assembly protein W